MTDTFCCHSESSNGIFFHPSDGCDILLIAGTWNIKSLTVMVAVALNLDGQVALKGYFSHLFFIYIFISAWRETVNHSAQKKIVSFI